MVRLTSYRHREKICVGMARDDDNVIEIGALILTAGSEWRHGPAPTSMLELIGAGKDAITDLALISEKYASLSPSVSGTEIEWLPPVPKPGKIVGVAMNNSASNDRKILSPDHPLFFIKPSTALLGHLQPMQLRSYYEGVHPEPELAVVIGRRCRDLAVNSALDAVFGYTILNDLTGNVMRGQDMVHYYALYASKDNPLQLERREQHLSYAARYKGTDGFAPLGPWLVTAEEVGDPGQLDVTCWVGEELIAQDNTRYYTYSVAEILAYLSQFQTLEPGDVISMGTAFRPGQGERRSLHTADLQVVDGPVRVTISKLGTLITPVGRVVQDLAPWRLDQSAAN